MSDELLEQIDNFFEYEKNDSLIEFKLNYQNFVCDNRLMINKRLLGLYKQYLEDSMNDYNQEDDVRFKTQSKEIIKKLKKIISYLEQEQKSLLSQKQVIVKKTKKKKTKKNKNIIINEDHLPLATEDLSKYPFSKSLDIFIQSLKSKQIDNNIITQSEYIKNYCLCETIDNQNVINDLNSISNVIRSRIKRYDKNDERRKILKIVANEFKYINLINKQDESEKDNLFLIVDYFLAKEDYYLYFKELVKHFPSIVNIRYNDKHILNYILSTFISNYKIMLTSKKSNYINKDYLKSIYLLILRNKKLSISREELKELDKMLIEFMNFVNKNITSSKRKNTVKLDLKDMYSDKMYMPKKVELLNEIDNYKLDNQIDRMYDMINMNNIINDCDEAMQISPYAAISFDEDIIKVHVLDLYGLIINHTELNKYMYNLLIYNETDQEIENALQMKVGKIYPVVTYEIGEELNISKNKIKINNLDTSKLKPYYDVTSLDCKETLENKIEKILNHYVIKYFNKNKLPFVYSGCIKNESEKEIILNDLTHALSKLEKKDFNKIYNILYNYQDKFHYEMIPFNGQYSLNIINPVNYIGITIQRIIREVILEDRNTEKERNRVIKKYDDELRTLVATINYYNDYVDKEVLKSNKGKLIKKQKMFF